MEWIRGYTENFFAPAFPPEEPDTTLVFDNIIKSWMKNKRNIVLKDINFPPEESDTTVTTLVFDFTIMGPIQTWSQKLIQAKHLVKCQ